MIQQYIRNILITTNNTNTKPQKS